MHINKIIDDAPFGKFYVSLFSLSVLIMILEGIDIQIIGFVASSIIDEWGIPAANFGIVFSSGLAGAMVGAMTLGALGDKVGRRPLILVCLIISSLGTLLTPFVSSITVLVLLRFFTSLGLGGVIPNLLALCAELAPSRFRSSFVGTVATSQLLGGVLGGAVSSWLIDAYGWQAILYLAGGLSILIILPVYFVLPESLRFLVQKGKPAHRIEGLIKRLNGENISASKTQTDGLSREDSNTIDLFREGRAPITILLWLAIGFNLFMTAFIIYWLPTLLVQLGVSLPKAIISITVMNAAGIIGGVSLSFAINKFGPYYVLGAGYFIAAVSVSTIGFIAPYYPGIILVVFITGFFGLGGFAGANLLSSTLYPTRLRSAGVGGAIAASKAGAILGPLAASAGLAINIPLEGVFMVCAIGGIGACVSILLLSLIHLKSDRIVIDEAATTQEA